MNMTMSQAGQRFLYMHEAQRGVSNRLYWPGGSSGVTLGAGYDMKERDRAQIAGELALLGLAPAACQSAAAAAGLCGALAEAFVRGAEGLLDLSEAQEQALMLTVLPPYEAIVRNEVLLPLAQHQFDALVSFAYNPGGSFREVAALINAGSTALAVNMMRDRVFSGGRRIDGLVRRRADEVKLYLAGCY